MPIIIIVTIVGFFPSFDIIDECIIHQQHWTCIEMSIPVNRVDFRGGKKKQIFFRGGGGQWVKCHLLGRGPDFEVGVRGGMGGGVFKGTLWVPAPLCTCLRCRRYGQNPVRLMAYKFPQIQQCIVLLLHSGQLNC
jgi:hypothetical protein